MQKVRRVISVVVMNESSVLARVTSLFAGRGYNIESLTVAPIPGSELSHITIVTNGSSKVIEQIIRPTGLMDPVIEIRPASGQVDDLLGETAPSAFVLTDECGQAHGEGEGLFFVAEGFGFEIVGEAAGGAVEQGVFEVGELRR
jgi:hypothetical protein